MCRASDKESLNCSNKGPMAEMLAGLELLHHFSANLHHDLYYWVRQAKNATAEIDYLLSQDLHVLPFEVKAGVQGGMKAFGTLCATRN